MQRVDIAMEIRMRASYTGEPKQGGETKEKRPSFYMAMGREKK
jgi:hypothetical protein